MNKKTLAGLLSKLERFMDVNPDSIRNLSDSAKSRVFMQGGYGTNNGNCFGVQNSNCSNYLCHDTTNSYCYNTSCW